MRQEGWEKRERKREKERKRIEREKAEYLRIKQEEYERIRAKLPCSLPADVIEIHLVPALLWFACDGPGGKTTYNHVLQERTEEMTIKDLLLLLTNTALVCQQWCKSVQDVTGLFNIRHCQSNGSRKKPFHSCLILQRDAGTLWHRLNPGRSFQEKSGWPLPPRHSPESWGMPWRSSDGTMCHGLCLAQMCSPGLAQMCSICLSLKEHEHTCVICDAIFCDRCAHNTRNMLLGGGRPRNVCADKHACHMRRESSIDTDSYLD